VTGLKRDAREREVLPYHRKTKRLILEQRRNNKKSPSPCKKVARIEHPHESAVETTEGGREAREDVVLDTSWKLLASLVERRGGVVREAKRGMTENDASNLHKGNQPGGRHRVADLTSRALSYFSKKERG